jgi:uncharacterized protein (DUF433 family)
MASERAKNMKAVEEHLVVVDPEIMGGVAVFASTRAPIESLFDWLAGGHSLEEFLDNFPSVERSQAIELLELAKEHFIDAYSARRMFAKSSEA